MADAQKQIVNTYISSGFPDAPGLANWMNTIGLFKDLEKQHDFGKFGLTFTIINHRNANDFKTEEAKAVSITPARSIASRTGNDANTIQAFLNIDTNSKVYIPGLASGWANAWGRILIGDLPQTVTFHGAAPTSETGIDQNTSNRAQKYNTPWIHKCYFRFLNASSQVKYWRITAVYSKNLHPIKRARQKALNNGGKASAAWVKYKNYAVKMGGLSHKHVLKGINLLNALEIPNHSMCVRDMEGGAGAFFKAVRGKNPTIVVGPNQGNTYNAARDLMRMYSYADCVTDSDPNKSKVYCDNFGIFNTDSQVIISAITNKRRATVKAHNPQLRMKFNILHTTNGMPASWRTATTPAQIGKGKNGNVNLRVGKVKQVWSQPASIPAPKAGLAPSAFIIPNAPEDNEAVEIVSSWEEKNAGNNFAEILDTTANSGLSLTSLQSAAYGLQRKQGGDRFQGWQVRNLKNITSPVVEHCWNFNGRNAPTPMARQDIGGTLYYVPHPSLASIWARGNGDAFVITGDIPFLCWCLRNDVNVLFGSLGDGNENPKFVYFRVQD